MNATARMSVPYKRDLSERLDATCKPPSAHLKMTVLIRAVAIAAFCFGSVTAQLTCAVCPGQHATDAPITMTSTGQPLFLVGHSNSGAGSPTFCMYVPNSTSPVLRDIKLIHTSQVQQRRNAPLARGVLFLRGKALSVMITTKKTDKSPSGWWLDVESSDGRCVWPTAADKYRTVFGGLNQGPVDQGCL